MRKFNQVSVAQWQDPYSRSIPLAVNKKPVFHTIATDEYKRFIEPVYDSAHEYRRTIRPFEDTDSEEEEEVEEAEIEESTGPADGDSTSSPSSAPPAPTVVEVEDVGDTAGHETTPALGDDAVAAVAPATETALEANAPEDEEDTVQAVAATEALVVADLDLEGDPNEIIAIEEPGQLVVGADAELEKLLNEPEGDVVVHNIAIPVPPLEHSGAPPSPTSAKKSLKFAADTKDPKPSKIWKRLLPPKAPKKQPAKQPAKQPSKQPVPKQPSPKRTTTPSRKATKSSAPAASKSPHKGILKTPQSDAAEISEPPPTLLDPEPEPEHPADELHVDGGEVIIEVPESNDPEPATSDATPPPPPAIEDEVLAILDEADAIAVPVDEEHISEPTDLVEAQHDEPALEELHEELSTPTTSAVEEDVVETEEADVAPVIPTKSEEELLAEVLAEDPQEPLPLPDETLEMSGAVPSDASIAHDSAIEVVVEHAPKANDDLPPVIAEPHGDLITDVLVDEAGDDAHALEGDDDATVVPEPHSSNEDAGPTEEAEDPSSEPSGKGEGSSSGVSDEQEAHSVSDVVVVEESMEGSEVDLPEIPPPAPEVPGDETETVKNTDHEPEHIVVAAEHSLEDDALDHSEETGTEAHGELVAIEGTVAENSPQDMEDVHDDGLHEETAAEVDGNELEIILEDQKAVQEAIDDITAIEDPATIPVGEEETDSHDHREPELDTHEAPLTAVNDDVQEHEVANDNTTEDHHEAASTQKEPISEGGLPEQENAADHDDSSTGSDEVSAMPEAEVEAMAMVAEIIEEAAKIESEIVDAVDEELSPETIAEAANEMEREEAAFAKSSSKGGSSVSGDHIDEKSERSAGKRSRRTRRSSVRSEEHPRKNRPRNDSGVSGKGLFGLFSSSPKEKHRRTSAASEEPMKPDRSRLEKEVRRIREQERKVKEDERRQKAEEILRAKMEVRRSELLRKKEEEREARAKLEETRHQRLREEKEKEQEALRRAEEKRIIRQEELKVLRREARRKAEERIAREREGHGDRRSREEEQMQERRRRRVEEAERVAREEAEAVARRERREQVRFETREKRLADIHAAREGDRRPESPENHRRRRHHHHHRS